MYCFFITVFKSYIKSDFSLTYQLIFSFIISLYLPVQPLYKIV